MADRYWVGGTATWNSTDGTKWATSSGSAGGASSPTAADNVIFDAASTGTCTMASTSVCRSLDCNGFTGTISHPAATILTIGDATAGVGSRALRLSTGMTYTLGSTITSSISFVSTSATVQTITTNAKLVGNLTFNGLAGSWRLADALTGGSTLNTQLIHTAGTLDTNGVAVSMGLFVGNGSAVRTLTLGTSLISFGSVGVAFNTSSSTNFTITANTATVTFTGAGANPSFGPTNFNGLSVVFSGAGACSFTGTPTFANLTRTATAVKTDSLSIAGNVTVTSALSLTGPSAINRLLVFSSVPGTSRTITAGSVSLSNVDFADITGAGLAANAAWTGSSLGDAQGNSNITCDTPATQTHTASAGGNWSDVTKWTSRVPLPQDDVIVNAGTTGTLTGDMPRLGKNVNLTGFAGTFAPGTALVYGGWINGSATLLSGTATLTFRGRGSYSLVSSGVTWSCPLVFDGLGGTWTLSDDLADSRAAAAITVTSGTLDTNGRTVTCTSTSGTLVVNGGTLVTGASSFILNCSTGTFWTVSSGSVSGALCTITLSTASASIRTFAGGGQSYGTLTYIVAGSSGGLDITGANTFDTINFSDASNARTLRFTAGTTTVVTAAWNVNGTSGKLMTVDSITAATHTLSKANGTVSSNYLSVKNSIATGGAAWYAGANSTDVSGNTGWIFAAPNVSGSQATTTSTGLAGSPSVAVGGAQASVTSTGNAGAAVVALPGSQASTTETGSPGGAFVLVAGVQAAETNTPRAGALAMILPGATAVTTSTANAGSVVFVIVGQVGFETSIALAGSAAVFGPPRDITVSLGTPIPGWSTSSPIFTRRVGAGST